MKLGRFHQYALERKRYEVDYTQWLKPGETITSYTAIGSGVTVDGVAQASGIAVFYASASAAVAGLVTITIVTSLGQTKIDVIGIAVTA